MCSLVHLRVADLQRIRVGPVELGNLPEGRWRPLSHKERAALIAASVGKAAVAKSAKKAPAPGPKARKSSGVAVSGDRPRKAAKCLMHRMCPFCVFSHSPRISMSSIIRWRSGVVFSSFMGTVLFDGGKEPNRQPRRACHKEKP
jgi:hypothetical protein